MTQSLLHEIDGESRAWAKKWPAIAAGPNRCLWTAGDALTPHQRRLRAYWRMLEEHKPRPEWECVELGAGRGTISQYLAAIGCRVVLTDLCQLALDTAVRNWREAGLPPPECLAVDCQHTKLKRERFTLAHSVGLLEHFDDPLPTLRESRRLLRLGGLSWHIIVAGHRAGSDVFRSEREADDYSRLAERAGLAGVECRPTMYRDVLLLTGWRR